MTKHLFLLALAVSFLPYLYLADVVLSKISQSSIGQGTVSSLNWYPDFGFALATRPPGQSCDLMTALSSEGSILWTSEGNITCSKSYKIHHILVAYFTFFVSGSIEETGELGDSINATIHAYDADTSLFKGSIKWEASNAFLSAESLPFMAVVELANTQLKQKKIYIDLNAEENVFSSEFDLQVFDLQRGFSTVKNVKLDASDSSTYFALGTKLNVETNTENSYVSKNFYSLSSALAEWSTLLKSSGVNTPEDAALNTVNRQTYVVGSTTGAFPGQTNQGKSDAFLACLNSTGGIEWAVQWGTAEDDVALSVSYYGSRTIVVAASENGVGVLKTFSTSNGAVLETAKVDTLNRLSNIIVQEQTADVFKGYLAGTDQSGSIYLYNLTAIPLPPPPPPTTTRGGGGGFIQTILRNRSAAVIGGSVLGSFIFCCGGISLLIWWLQKRIEANKAKSLAVFEKSGGGEPSSDTDPFKASKAGPSAPEMSDLSSNNNNI